MALLLRGKARSNQFFGTPSSATTLLLRGQTRSDRCFGTPTSATTLLLCRQARSERCFGTPISIIPSGTYCVVSYSFLMIGLSSQIVI